MRQASRRHPVCAATCWSGSACAGRGQGSTRMHQAGSWDWRAWGRRQEMATWCMGDDVARDALAKRRSKRTKTASRSEWGWKESQSEQKSPAEEAGGRVGDG